MKSIYKFSVYKTRVKNRLVLLNPILYSGVVILNKEAEIVYNSIINGVTKDKLLIKLKKFDSKITIKELNKILKEFIVLNLVYINKPKKQISKNKILDIWFQLTNDCNLRCSYCYVPKKSKKMDLKIAKKAIDKIVEMAEKYNFSKIKVKFAGGEPLLMQKLISEIIQYSEKYEIDFDFVIITNGTLITQNLLDELKNKVSFAISIDGTEKTHNQSRPYENGMGSFKQVKRGFDLLLKNKIKFNVSVVITSKNIYNLKEMTDFFLKEKVNFVFNLFRENPNAKNDMSLKPTELIRELKKLYKYIEKIYPSFLLIEKLCDTLISFRPRKYGCGSCQDYFSVLFDGTISSCQMASDNLGFILKIDPIKKIRNLPRSKFNLIDNKKDCQKCNWKYLCGGGCTLLTKRVNGNYYSKSPYCFVYKKIIPELIKTQAKMILRREKNEIK
jgi:uncharacterized protein